MKAAEDRDFETITAMRCAACRAEIAKPGRFCPECAAPLAADGHATKTIAIRQKRPSSSSDSGEDGRFPPGTLLGERYRIVAIIGRGGMGEVYRASDLKLNQPVALKFLPAAVAAKPGLLERFHGEVRIARQVSHPNVCRVYDIGEAEGSAFISMEYVDGEDLGSLLRRIGRLPHDKAVEIARKLCAGLAAAHAKGVLHRDLKPANIMIDGRGQVLIMDFGLAALADRVAGAEVRNGTPAYMAPEQLAGKEVSERSDIYALGLVLYEVFTGQRAFKTTDGKTADRSAIPSTASIVRDVDPLIERAIARCLEPEPAKRPQSALAVARILPGGDPLAEALAAGDTPSPELVANSGSTEGLRVPVAVACLAAVIVGIVALCWIAQRRNFVNQTPMEFAPEVLAAKARDIAASFGYTQRPVDRAFGWFKDQDYVTYALKQPDSAQRLAHLGTNRPPVLNFWYREAPRYLVPTGGGAVSLGNPPAAERGNLQMLLDSEGRLLQFQARPAEKPDADKPDSETPGGGKPPSEADFQKLLAAAGLDPFRMTAAEPTWVPPSAFYTRAAWTVKEGLDSMRVEAATWQGRVVAFERLFPWNVSAPSNDATIGGLPLLLPPLMAVAVAVAWRNLRLGRGDKRGANRLAGFVLVCTLTAAFCDSHHLPSGVEVGVLLLALRNSLGVPVVVWLVYVAFEPYLRRYAPNTLIGWSRLLEGRWRDPLVGGQLLAGVAAGLGVSVVLAIGPGNLIAALSLPVDGMRSVAWLANMMTFGMSLSLMFTLLWLLFRIPARRNWLASALMAGTVAAAFLPFFGLAALGVGIVAAALALIIMRLGVLAAVAYYFGLSCAGGNAPWTTSVSVWYARTAMLAIAAILAVAIYGFRTTLAGRPLWRDELQKDIA
ncbi:MAG TPA: serine/threonine-protein kinase [Bryobacteraceae bacterium]|nr:serine/threonine-protein kinase [Bryobacteraceae bacterium]